MKYIILESKMYYLRRLSLIDELIESSIGMFDDWDRPNLDVEYMVNFLSVDVAELYFFRFSEEEYVNEEEYEKLWDFLHAYLNTNWKDKLESLIKSHRRK
jgi:hypothetical protein